MPEQAQSTLINDLLADSQEEQVQEEVVDEKPEETHEEKVVEKSEENVITAELAKEYGLQAWMIGKPISELGKAYKNLNAEFTRRNQKQSELEKKVSELESKMLAQADSRAEKQEIKDLFDEMPDPVEKLPEFRKWMKNVISNTKTEAETNLMKKIEGSLTKVDEFNSTQRQTQIYESIQSALPEDANVDDLIVEWGQANGIIGDEESINYFLNRPKLMTNSIVAFYESKDYKNLKSDLDKKVGDEVVTKTKKTLQDVKSKKADLATAKRIEPKVERSSLMQDVLDSLEE